MDSIKNNYLSFKDVKEFLNSVHLDETTTSVNITVENWNMLCQFFSICKPDIPDADGTDFAHPAWWRGHEMTTIELCSIIEELIVNFSLEKEQEILRGQSNEPWNTTKRLIILMTSLAHTSNSKKDILDLVNVNRFLTKDNKNDNFK